MLERFILEMSDEDYKKWKTPITSTEGPTKTGDAIVDQWERDLHDESGGENWYDLARETFDNG